MPLLQHRDSWDELPKRLYFHYSVKMRSSLYELRDPRLPGISCLHNIYSSLNLLVYNSSFELIEAGKIKRGAGVEQDSKMVVFILPIKVG